jgi:hypothetical protein
LADAAKFLTDALTAATWALTFDSVAVLGEAARSLTVALS